jgi:hypothetical protein
VPKLPKECLARADRLSKSLRDAVAASLRAAAKVKRISDEIQKYESSSQLPPSWPKHKLLFETAEHQIPVPYELQSFQVTFSPGTSIKDTLRLLHSNVVTFSKKLEVHMVKEKVKNLRPRLDKAQFIAEMTGVVDNRQHKLDQLGAILGISLASASTDYSASAKAAAETAYEQIMIDAANEVDKQRAATDENKRREERLLHTIAETKPQELLQKTIRQEISHALGKPSLLSALDRSIDLPKLMSAFPNLEIDSLDEDSFKEFIMKTFLAEANALRPQRSQTSESRGKGKGKGSKDTTSSKGKSKSKGKESSNKGKGKSKSPWDQNLGTKAAASPGEGANKGKGKGTGKKRKGRGRGRGAGK